MKTECPHGGPDRLECDACETARWMPQPGALLPTPRTNSTESDIRELRGLKNEPGNDEFEAMAEFARSLERELAAHPSASPTGMAPANCAVRGCAGIVVKGTCTGHGKHSSAPTVMGLTPLLDRLSTEGGCIVPASGCHEIEIADAKVRGDWFVNDAGCGFVRRLSASTAGAGKCFWYEDGEGSDTWVSECGSTWQFTNDGPKENGFNFCHSCGKPCDYEPSPTKDQA